MVATGVGDNTLVEFGIEVTDNREVVDATDGSEEVVGEAVEGNNTVNPGEEFTDSETFTELPTVVEEIFEIETAGDELAESGTPQDKAVMNGDSG